MGWGRERGTLRQFLRLSWWGGGVLGGSGLSLLQEQIQIFAFWKEGKTEEEAKMKTKEKEKERKRKEGEGDHHSKNL